MDGLNGVQGGHVFEKLNSLSFLWDFNGIFQLFPEKHEWEKFAGIHFHCGLCHMSQIFPEFSRFCTKIKNFPEFSLKFWQFSKFPEFSRFVATLEWGTHEGPRSGYFLALARKSVNSTLITRQLSKRQNLQLTGNETLTGHFKKYCTGNNQSDFRISCILCSHVIAQNIALFTACKQI